MITYSDLIYIRALKKKKKKLKINIIINEIKKLKKNW